MDGEVGVRWWNPGVLDEAMPFLDSTLVPFLYFHDLEFGPWLLAPCSLVASRFSCGNINYASQSFYVSFELNFNLKSARGAKNRYYSTTIKKDGSLFVPYCL